jgi:lyso-ornithine lipid O-acyltransferase
VLRTVRIAARLAAIIATLLVALAFHGLWRLARSPSPWPRRFLAAMTRIVGARVRVEGVPLTRDVVILANHLSWIDIFALASATGCAFVAKGELEHVPAIGWLASLNRTIFVARADRMGVEKQVATIRTAISTGQPIAIFPEGTTGDGTTLLPFKPALLAALDPAPPGVRVQPVRIDYGLATAELAWVGEVSGVAHALRVLGRRGSFTVRLQALDPFDPAAFAGRKAIAAEARHRVEAAVH